MINLSPQDEKILTRAIIHGEAALFLGAGASATSLSIAGTSILLGTQLAQKLAEVGGLDYNNEVLPSVVAATVGSRISRVQFENILRDEFLHCSPSNELKDLMTFCWARIYTWNLDDTISNCPNTAQKLQVFIQVFNGMVDQVTPNNNIAHLQVIHLHGEALKLHHGYIFSESEYNTALSRGHPWYKQAASDYIEILPIFVGSKLSEPILSLELDRARPNRTEGLGVAFLVSPDTFTPIQLAEFESRHISVVQGTLLEFVDFLRRKISSDGVSPLSVTSSRGEAGRLMAARGNVTTADLSVAQHLQVIASANGDIHIRRLPDDETASAARLFLEGKPPTWEVVFADISPILEQVRTLREQVEECYSSDERLFIVYGQSASGKTTGIMQALLQLARAHGNIPIYEIKGNTPTLKNAIGLLTRLHPEEKVIVYFGEAFIFGDSFAEDLLSVNAGRLLLVGDARVNEWRNHTRRRLEGVNFRSFEFQRFEREDYDDLANAILQYVPAPGFHKLTPSQRIQEFAKSRSQLLIAMKEVTQSKRFRDIITFEYNGLPDDDCRVCFLICGLATLARSGIGRGMAKEAYESLCKQRDFVSAIGELAGIVSEDRNGRLVARHDIYVRHILEDVASIDVLYQSVVEVLQSFTKFDVPVIKSVGRQDGILFRFMLNHNFLKDLFGLKGDGSYPRKIYSRFEIEFQRDGHFWLQYGQYLSAMRLYEEALPILEKSIQAYPENEYAAHALADIQLRVAAEAPSWNNSVAGLIGHAVSKLEELHENRDRQTDQYAIVTLSEKHIGALVKHGRLEEAREAAKRYFNEIGRSRVSDGNQMLEQARTRLLHFLTHGKISGNGEEAENVAGGGRGRRGRRRRPR